MAASSSNLDEVKLLLAAKAVVNVQNAIYGSPLHVTDALCSPSSTAIVELLL